MGRATNLHLVTAHRTSCDRAFLLLDPLNGVHLRFDSNGFVPRSNHDGRGDRGGCGDCSSASVPRSNCGGRGDDSSDFLLLDDVRA